MDEEPAFLCGNTDYGRQQTRLGGRYCVRLLPETLTHINRPAGVKLRHPARAGAALAGRADS